MAIEVGKYVVAIKNHSEGLFKEGQVFSCKGIRSTNCSHSVAEIDIGLTSNHDVTGYCSTCYILREPSKSYWFKINSFRALDDITPSIEEIIEELEPLKQEVL